MEENQEPSGRNFNSHRPIPPITIDNIQKSSELLRKIQEITKQKLKGRVIGKGLRVYPETPEAYHTIRNFINKEKLESSTYQLQDDKDLKAVIRGMPSDTPPQDIIDELYQMGITPNTPTTQAQPKTPPPVNPVSVSQASTKPNQPPSQPNTRSNNNTPKTPPSHTSNVSELMSQMRDPKVTEIFQVLRKIIQISKSEKSLADRTMEVAALLQLDIAI
ncbi:hypothetical protein TNCT_447811 [Trichonephila clavata]|uniref:Uncharacterized protein n=1 Tax=Trichonephila clavata TaxID=2740835 RepID=A0A8X6HK80_TRICU|nr:hypothetical protein TNCT_447811 [Trichonephila clavata]